MQQVKLNFPGTLVRPAELLRAGTPVLLHFAAQMTHIPVLIVPDTAITFVGYEKSFTGGPKGTHWYVTVVGLGSRTYMFPPNGSLHVGYVQEKLQLSHEGDVRNLVVLLNALSHEAGPEYYLSHIPLRDDHLDHEAYDKDSSVLHVQ